ncbi:hypothetical protein J6590_004953 [Homalodisca vitripennis]|nr:hypothetical protein J6590_004953 [Homalodisca vitripennis]
MSSPDVKVSRWSGGIIEALNSSQLHVLQCEAISRVVPFSFTGLGSSSEMQQNYQLLRIICQSAEDHDQLFLVTAAVVAFLITLRL